MNTQVTLKIRRFRKNAIMPSRGSDLAAGFDLYAWSQRAAKTTVKNDEYPDIATGIEVGFLILEDLEPHHLVENWEDTLTDGSVVIPPGTMMPIKTGLNMRIPAGYEVQIRPRSGLAFKNQITVQNAPGTIDADYDGDGEKFEIVVMLRNEGSKEFVVKHGDRIAQMVLNKLPDCVIVEDFNDNTCRNASSREGGLGSTGV